MDVILNTCVSTINDLTTLVLSELEKYLQTVSGKMKHLIKEHGIVSLKEPVN